MERDSLGDPACQKCGGKGYMIRYAPENRPRPPWENRLCECARLGHPNRLAEKVHPDRIITR